MSNAISNIWLKFLISPSKEANGAAWYICGEETDGLLFKFRITSKYYILSHEKGRFLLDNLLEIKEYKRKRREDAEKQLKNVSALI